MKETTMSKTFLRLSLLLAATPMLVHLGPAGNSFVTATVPFACAGAKYCADQPHLLSSRQLVAVVHALDPAREGVLHVRQLRE